MPSKKKTSNRKKSTKKTVKKAAAVSKTTAAKASAKKKPAAKKKTAARATKAATAKTTKKVAAKTTKSAAKSTATPKTSTKKKSTRRVSQKKAANGARAAIAPVNGHLADEPQELTLEQLRKVKTGLSKKDLAAFEHLLLEKRAEIVGDVESLQTDARNGGGAISYEHMADVGTDSYEQEFTLGLVESERRLLREIDEALDRIGNGTYGVCIESGQPIGRPRLEAKPWAKYSIEVARQRESRRY